VNSELNNTSPNNAVNSKTSKPWGSWE